MKKNSPLRNPALPLSSLLKITCISILLFVACSTPSQVDQVQINDADAVPADPTLETVTWNLQWYGSNFSGPTDFTLQTKNIVRVVDSLNADLYAFEEVNHQKSLDDIVTHMPGYKGFTADYISRDQQMAVVYNTTTIDSLEAGPISAGDVREEYQADWSYFWASGRLPLYFRFTYTFENTTKEFYAVVIHGKANYGETAGEYAEAYERRKKAAEGLYYYLQDHKPDANIILLGDYNDDVDQSIYYITEGNYAETPYYKFVNDQTHFDVLTKKLSDSGISASVNYEDIIDHITISDELFDEYVTNSTAVYDEPQSYITDYGQTTSDHLPVWAKFDVTKAKESSN